MPENDPLVIAVRELVDGWRDKKWGLLANRIREVPTPTSMSSFAGEIRERFAAQIDDWQLESFELIAPYSADVSCRQRRGEREWVTTTKWSPDRLARSSTSSTRTPTGVASRFTRTSSGPDF